MFLPTILSIVIGLLFVNVILASEPDKSGRGHGLGRGHRRLKVNDEGDEQEAMDTRINILRISDVAQNEAVRREGAGKQIVCEETQQRSQVNIEGDARKQADNLVKLKEPFIDYEGNAYMIKIDRNYKEQIKNYTDAITDFNEARMERDRARKQLEEGMMALKLSKGDHGQTSNDKEDHSISIPNFEDIDYTPFYDIEFTHFKQAAEVLEVPSYIPKEGVICGAIGDKVIWTLNQQPYYGRNIIKKYQIREGRIVIPAPEIIPRFKFGYFCLKEGLIYFNKKL